MPLRFQSTSNSILLSLVASRLLPFSVITGSFQDYYGAELRLVALLFNFCEDLIPSYEHTFDFPSGSDGKVSAYNAGDLGSIPGLGRSPEKEMATHSSILAWEIP